MSLKREPVVETREAGAASVLFLDHTAALGGAELFLETLAMAWRGPRKVVLFSDGPLRQRLETGTVPVEVIPASGGVLGVGRGGGGLAQVLAIPGVVRLAQEVAAKASEFDVLFANTQKALVVGAVASCFAGKPLVWYLHDIVTADHFSAVNRKLSVLLGNHFAARVIANSEASRQAFISCGGRSDHVSVVYNGIGSVSGERFTVSSGNSRQEAGKRLRAEIGYTDAPLVGVFSRLAPWKGQHVLLDALTMVPDLQAILVGAPLFGEEIQYQRRLEAQVRESGMSERVRFLGFREDIPELLDAVDIVAHTSVAPEPFGRVIVEGMLAGKPVVATRAGGACEIISDGVTGRLVALGDATALANVLRALIDSPEEADTLGSAGRRSALERFSVEAMLSGVEGVVGTVSGER